MQEKETEILNTEQEITSNETPQQEEVKAQAADAQPTEQNDDAENLTDEEKEQRFKQFLFKLDQEGKKLIPLPEIPEELVTKISAGIEQLTALRDEVLEKKAVVVEQGNQIKDRVNKLIEEKAISITEEELKASHESINKYSDILQKISDEVSQEISYFSQFVQDPHPNFVIVWKQEPDLGSSFLESKVKWIRKYAKTVKKDLLISYSRYNLGFESQMKKLDFAHQYAQFAKKHAKEHDKKDD